MLVVPHTTKVIYIVEDDPASASMIREALELEGEPSWCMHVIGDGDEAMVAINTVTPDLVLLDLTLPGADGGTIYHELQTNGTDSQKMPVLFITGATTHDLHNRGIDEGVLLRKPVNLDVLIDVVRAHLDAN